MLQWRCCEFDADVAGVEKRLEVSEDEHCPWCCDSLFRKAWSEFRLGRPSGPRSGSFKSIQLTDREQTNSISSGDRTLMSNEGHAMRWLRKSVPIAA